MELIEELADIEVKGIDQNNLCCLLRFTIYWLNDHSQAPLTLWDSQLQPQSGGDSALDPAFWVPHAGPPPVEEPMGSRAWDLGLPSRHLSMGPWNSLPKWLPWSIFRACTGFCFKAVLPSVDWAISALTIFPTINQKAIVRTACEWSSATWL